MLLLTHVFPRSPDDHAAPFLLRYTRGLRTAGVDVRVVAPHDAGLPARHDVDGVPVARVRYGADRRERLAYRGEMHRLVRRPAGLIALVRLLWSLRRAVRREIAAGHPDVLEIHWMVPGALVARLVGGRPPVRLHVHGTDAAVLRPDPLRRRLGRWLLGVADSVVVVSEELGELCDDAFGRRAHEIEPMPVGRRPPRRPPAHRTFGPGRPARPTILAVGRLVPEKGHDLLLDAVARLTTSGPPPTVTIAGDGPERERLAAAADRLGVALRLLGAVAPSRLGDLYDRADVVAVPSRREGFGLVAAEALLHGRPVVASAVGGLPRLLGGHDPAGWLVPPDDVDALTAALERALTDPDEARRRARRGRDRVADATEEAVGARAAAALARLARRRSSEGDA